MYLAAEVLCLDCCLGEGVRRGQERGEWGVGVGVGMGG